MGRANGRAPERARARGARSAGCTGCGHGRQGAAPAQSAGSGGLARLWGRGRALVRAPACVQGRGKATGGAGDGMERGEVAAAAKQQQWCDMARVFERIEERLIPCRRLMQLTIY